MVGSSSPSHQLFVSCGGCGALHRPWDGLALHPFCERCRSDGGPAEPGARQVRALDERTVAEAITRTSPGSYVLGYLDDSDFTPFYVGRSDSDVAVTLQDWVDAPSRRRRGRSSCAEPWRMRAVAPRGSAMRLPAGASFGSDTGYTHFAFRYAPSAMAAFEQECRDYHDLGGHDGLDNAAHPQPPTDSPWACPLHG